MPTLANKISYCEQCGAPLKSGATELGCLNCLLLGGPNDSSHETRRFQHYEICLRDEGVTFDELGRGAMGITYRALDVNLGSVVALKTISARYSGNSRARERFHREARAAAQLRHPNVASVFHFGETPIGQCFYAMELIEGETLEARIRRDGPLPVPGTLEVAIQVARALLAAEAHGLVHRDLKPSNLMVVGDASGGTDALVVKVIDFGLAKAVAAMPIASGETHVGFSGTPDFASPEQFRAGDIALDVRSDIYSLGATLWYLLCGQAPFAGRAVGQAPDQPFPLEQLVTPRVPPPLIALLRSMLAADPAQRPQSARELLTALQRCRETVEATPRRRKQRRLAAVALGLLIISGFGLTSYLSHRQRVGDLATAAGLPEKSIAVLPFDNLSDDKQNAYFAGGMQDEILTNLAKIADLKVISRASVMQYNTTTRRNLREIGQQLGVTHLLEGSVQRASGKVRVHAQLIDARNDAQLWAQTYDRDMADVFAIQSEIARAIANQLQARLSPSEKAAIEKPPTTDFAAYDLYLRARALYADTTDQVHAAEKLPQAGRLLDEVVARDPHFLLAWVLLASVHSDIYFSGFDHTPARLDLAKAAVQAALRLQPDAGEAHLALADYYYHGFRDYERAGNELAIARRTLPNNAEVFEYICYINRRAGHWEEATRNLERALELDPRNFYTLQQLALTYQEVRRYADEARTYDRALTIVPGDPVTRINRAQVALDWQADIKPFQTTLATLLSEDPSVAPDVDDPFYALCERTSAAAARVLTNYPRDGVVYNGVNFPHAYWEGVVARWQGDSAKARAAFIAARSEVARTVEKQSDDAAALSLLGMIDAGLERKEEALREGRRACELLPISKDAIDGVAFAVNLAQIYTWTGEKDLAIEQIVAVERVPNFLSYGFLKLQPVWDSLRGDPRFEKIVASLAPKDR
jgi:serine/threonine protein kinase/Flp pilus assembly protein TadD